MEDYGLDVWMEDVINNGYGYIIDELNDDWYEYDQSQYDDDPNPYDGEYSEE